MKLIWDKVGEHFYETGVDRGVLAVLTKNGAYQPCVAWSGLTSISENASGAEPNPFYADNIKYLNLVSAEDFGLTVEAYTYPDEFEECLGRATPVEGVYIGNQKRSHFGFAYRTKLGNDVDGSDHGYKLHLVYNCLASPSGKDYSSINDSPEPASSSWEITTTPVDVPGYKPTAVIVLDSKKFIKSGTANVLWYIEDLLYGTTGSQPRFPTVKDVIEIAPKQAFLMDSSGNPILDNNGGQIRSFVYSK